MLTQAPARHQFLTAVPDVKQIHEGIWRGHGLDRQRLCQDAVADIAETVRGDHIHGRTEQILKVQLQSNQVEEGLPFFELHQQVDVAVVAVVAADHRTEHTDIPGAVDLGHTQNFGPAA